MRLPGLWRARMAVGIPTMALAAVLVSSTAPAGAAPTEESRLLALTNQLRASVGTPPVTFDESLAAVARAWAAKMAADGTISHNPDLGTQVTAWSKVSENVGMGPDVDTVHRALVASHSHYVNLVDAEVTVVGIGVVTAGTYVFVVENFLQPSGRAPAPATTTTRPPAAGPAVTTTTRLPAARPPTTTPPTTGAPAAAGATVPPPPAPPPAAVPLAGPPSPWLSLALELTRGWEGTSR